MMTKTSLLPLLGIIALPLMATQALAAAPLVEYNFNDYTAGNITSSNGSINYNLNFFDADSNPADLRGGAGSGVSGNAWDYAFDNTASSGMGTQGTGGRAQGSTDFTTMGGLQSFTLTGWINPSTQIDDSPNILANSNTNNEGVLISGNNGRLSISVNGSGSVSGSSAFSGTNTWLFFAITYDGTATSGNNVRFYVGGTETAVSLDIQRSVIAGTVIDPESDLTIGNVFSIRPFDGLMDNFAIYGSYDDASGVLSQTELEGIRQSALIPEASSSSLMGVLALLGLLFLRRFRRI